MLQNTWNGSVWGAGGAKLPSTLLHLSGTIRDEAINWGAGATVVVVWEAAVASTAIASNTEIGQGLYATPTGLSWTDGTDTAQYACTWAVGDVLVITLTITVFGKMKLGLLMEQSSSLWVDYNSWADAASWGN